jgi:hypothetical protein
MNLGQYRIVNVKAGSKCFKGQKKKKLKYLECFIQIVYEDHATEV